MKPELDKQLVESYSPLYRDRHGNMQDTAMCWGFECGDGWFNILDALSAEICSDWLQAKYDYDRLVKLEGKAPYEGADIVTAVDVEEARLKMEAESLKVPVAVQVKEKFGTLRFYLNGGDARVDALISMAERMTAVTCETCGSPGALTRGGWVSCLCDKCREEKGIMSIAEEREAAKKM